MKNISHILLLSCLTTMLSACGGGGDTATGTGGAPVITGKCQISQVQPSMTTGTLSKSNGKLSTNFNLNLAEATSIDITSNFENTDADDWIEAPNYISNLGKGSHSMVLNYDLNSTKKDVADRFNKLNITVTLPENEACVANVPVNITLNPG